MRFLENGGRTWARTKDPLIKSQLLYQLSYASIPYRYRRPGVAPLAIFGSVPSPNLMFLSRSDYPSAPCGERDQRSTAIRVPMHSMLVIIEEPPWLTKGRGMPTTGARPITIIRLMHK